MAIAIASGLATLGASGAAHAQATAASCFDPLNDACFVRTGVQPARDATLVRGARLDGDASPIDLEGDGAPGDEVASVRGAQRDGSEGLGDQPACVLFHRTSRGVEARVVGVSLNDHHECGWLEPVAAGTRRLAHLIATDFCDSDDASLRRAGLHHSLYYAARDGTVRNVGFVSHCDETLAFAARADGSIDVTATLASGRRTAVRTRVLVWNAAAESWTAPADWQRARPSRMTAGTPSAVGAATTAQACQLHAPEAFHLRPNETLASTGRAMPTGTPLTVVAAGSLTRRGLRIYRVRVGNGSAEGWLFLPRDRIPAPCSLR